MRISDWSSDVCSSDLLAVRLDTHGGRYVEGLDPQASYAVLERHVPNAIRQYRTEAELRWLVGTGVSAAALFHMRSEEHTSELQSLMRISYAVFCLKNKKSTDYKDNHTTYDRIT